MSTVSAGEGISSPSDCVETVWTDGWDGKNRESVDMESGDSKFILHSGKLVQHTDVTTHVSHLDAHGPEN